MAQSAAQKVQRKGRLKQGVCGGVFGRQMPFEERAKNAAQLGAQCFDLQGPDNWPILKKYGLVPTMVSGGGRLTDACNDKSLHAQILEQFKTNIPRGEGQRRPERYHFFRQPQGARATRKGWRTASSC